VEPVVSPSVGLKIAIATIKLGRRLARGDYNKQLVEEIGKRCASSGFRLSRTERRKLTQLFETEEAWVALLDSTGKNDDSMVHLVGPCLSDRGEKEQELAQQIVESAAFYFPAFLGPADRAAVEEYRDRARYEGLRSQLDLHGQMPIEPNLLDLMEKMRSDCESADRRFYTPHLLLALLELPSSHVTQCFNEVRPGSAEAWRQNLRRYRDKAKQDPRHPKYRPFEWNARPDIRSAGLQARQMGASQITELQVLVSILTSDRDSRTQRELMQYFGNDYERLVATAAELLDEEQRTPGPVLE
jgi:hypothetical protein